MTEVHKRQFNINLFAPNPQSSLTVRRVDTSALAPVTSKRKAPPHTGVYWHKKKKKNTHRAEHTPAQQQGNLREGFSFFFSFPASIRVVFQLLCVSLCSGYVWVMTSVDHSFIRSKSRLQGPEENNTNVKLPSKISSVESPPARCCQSEHRQRSWTLFLGADQSDGKQIHTLLY